MCFRTGKWRKITLLGKNGCLSYKVDFPEMFCLFWWAFEKSLNCSFDSIVEWFFNSFWNFQLQFNPILTLYSQGYGLPSFLIWLWELDRSQRRVPKSWCLQTVVLEETSESSFDSKEIKLIDLKGNQPWILIGRTDSPSEAPVFGHLMQRDDSLENPWYWERLRAEGERASGWDGWMASPTHWTWTWENFRDDEGQGGLACCSSQGSNILSLLHYCTTTIHLLQYYLQGNSPVSKIMASNVHVCVQLCLIFAISWPWNFPVKLLCPWNFPDNNTGVECHFLL